MIEFPALALAGFLDRVRGGFPQGRRPKWAAHVATSVAYTCVLFAILGNWWCLTGLLFGEVAWRHDNGWRGNWLRNDSGKKWWQPLRWGFFWSLPVILIAYWQPIVAVLLIAGPIGSLIATLVSQKLPDIDALELFTPWSWSELIELPIIGLLGILLLTVL